MIADEVSDVPIPLTPFFLF